MKKTLLSLFALAAMSATALAADVKPALVYGTGGKFDKSFNEAAYGGAEKFKTETGIDYRDFEPTSDTQGEQAGWASRFNLSRWALDGQRWVACRPGFFLPVRVLSRLFRRRFLEELTAAHRKGQLQFFSEHAGLADPAAFQCWLAPLRQCEWVVYAKKPFAGPQAVLAYLSRYTHRVAISNSRLVALDERGVTFRWKDYRDKGRVQGKTRHKTMTLSPEEFMRRFLLHVLPGGFHRIRHYGLLASSAHKDTMALARRLLGVAAPIEEPEPEEPPDLPLEKMPNPLVLFPQTP